MHQKMDPVGSVSVAVGPPCLLRISILLPDWLKMQIHFLTLQCLLQHGSFQGGMRLPKWTVFFSLTSGE